MPLSKMAKKTPNSGPRTLFRPIFEHFFPDV